MEKLKVYEDVEKTKFEMREFGIDSEIFICMEGLYSEKKPFFENLLLLESKELSIPNATLEYTESASADFVRGSTKLSIYKNLLGISHCNGVILCVDDASADLSELLLSYSGLSNKPIVLYAYSDSTESEISYVEYSGASYPLYTGKASSSFIDFLTTQFSSQDLYYTNRKFLDATVQPSMRVDLKLEKLSGEELDVFETIMGFKGVDPIDREKDLYYYEKGNYSKVGAYSNLCIADIIRAVSNNEALSMTFELDPIEISQSEASLSLQDQALKKFKNSVLSGIFSRPKASKVDPLDRVGRNVDFKTGAKILNALSDVEGLPQAFDVSFSDTIRKHIWESENNGYRYPTLLEFGVLLLGNTSRIRHILGLDFILQGNVEYVPRGSRFAQIEYLDTIVEDTPSPDLLYGLMSQHLEWAFTPSRYKKGMGSLPKYEQDLRKEYEILYSMASAVVSQLLAKYLVNEGATHILDDPERRQSDSDKSYVYKYLLGKNADRNRSSLPYRENSGADTSIKSPIFGYKSINEGIVMGASMPKFNAWGGHFLRALTNDRLGLGGRQGINIPFMQKKAGNVRLARYV